MPPPLTRRQRKAGARSCSPGVFPGFLCLGFRANLCSQATTLGCLDTCIPPGKLLERPPQAFIGAGQGGSLQACWAAGGAVLPPSDKYSPPLASEENQSPGPSHVRPGAGLPEDLRCWQTGLCLCSSRRPRGLSLPQLLSALQCFAKVGWAPVARSSLHPRRRGVGVRGTKVRLDNRCILSQPAGLEGVCF